MTAQTLPPAPGTSHIDHSRMKYMPLMIDDFCGSMLANFEASPYSINNIALCCQAYRAKPAGSVPDDDRQIMIMASFRGSVEEFNKHRATILHGFKLHEEPDGSRRWYHHYVVSQAIDIWNTNAPNRDRVKAANEARRVNAEAARQRKAEEERLRILASRSPAPSIQIPTVAAKAALIQLPQQFVSNYTMTATATIPSPIATASAISTVFGATPVATTSVITAINGHSEKVVEPSICDDDVTMIKRKENEVRKKESPPIPPQGGDEADQAFLEDRMGQEPEEMDLLDLYAPKTEAGSAYVPTEPDLLDIAPSRPSREARNVRLRDMPDPEIEHLANSYGWAEFKDAYPMRDGSMDWKSARKLFITQVLKHKVDPKELIRAAVCYRENMVDAGYVERLGSKPLIRSTFVMQPTRFLNPQKGEWEAAIAAFEQRALVLASGGTVTRISDARKSAFNKPAEPEFRRSNRPWA